MRGSGKCSDAHKPSVSQALLQRIRDGASKTRFLPRYIKQRLIDQGIIPA